MSKIDLVHGSCADQEADAVVNAANRYLLGGSGICGVIFSKAGDKDLAMACCKYKTPLNDGDAVITPSFNMRNCKAIIHAVGPDFRSGGTAGDLFKAYYNSLITMKENGYHSISFPLISSGIFAGDSKDPAGQSVKGCLEAYMKFTEVFPDYDIEVLVCAYGDREYARCLELFGDINR
jgi:O-acetyl-ADP-ribose deacetylase (regulator of RNase III)